MSRPWIPLVLLVAVVGLCGGCDDDPCRPDGFCSLAEEPFSETVPITTQVWFALVGINGNVEITGVAGATAVTVSGVRSVRSDSEEDAERRLEDLQVEKTVTEDGVRFQTVQPRTTEGRDYTVDHEVEIPADFPPTVIIVNGNISAAGFRQGGQFKSTNGMIEVLDQHGPMAALLTNGNITADVSLSNTESVSLVTVNGNLDLTIPEDTSASVTANLTNGFIGVSGLDFDNLNRTDHTLYGRLGTGQGGIVLTTVNGNISIRGR